MTNTPEVNCKPDEKLEKIAGISNPKDAESDNSLSLQERTERKEIAAQTIIDGTFEGAVIYDSASLAKAIGMRGSMGCSSEIMSSPTTFKDRYGRPIEEIIVSTKDHMGRELMKKAIGYIVQDSDGYVTKFN